MKEEESSAEHPVELEPFWKEAYNFKKFNNAMKLELTYSEREKNIEYE